MRWSFSGRDRPVEYLEDGGFRVADSTTYTPGEAEVDPLPLELQ